MSVKDCFFLTHWDTEKTAGMLATPVLTFPSTFRGFIAPSSQRMRKGLDTRPTALSRRYSGMSGPATSANFSTQ